MVRRKSGVRGIAGILENDHTEALEKTRRLQDILTNLRYEGRASLGKNLKQVREALGFLRKEWTRHVDLEEETLFPFLETHLPRLETLLHLLEAEHKDFKKNLKDLQVLLQRIPTEKSFSNHGRIFEKIREQGNYLVYLLRNHIRVETESVYKAVRRDLRPAEKKELKNQIHQRRNRP